MTCLSSGLFQVLRSPILGMWPKASFREARFSDGFGLASRAT
jgi:hypothetical protein